MRLDPLSVVLIVPPPVSVTVAELAIRLVSSLPLASVTVPTLSIVPSRASDWLSSTVTLPRVVNVLAEPSNVPPLTKKPPPPVVDSVPPAMVPPLMLMLPPAAMTCPEVPLLMVVCSTSPPVPVASTSPLLVKVPLVLMTSALLALDALTIPAVPLMKVSV